jgi:hypothetical protein
MQTDAVMTDKTVGEVFGFTEPLDMSGYQYPHDPQSIKHAVQQQKIRQERLSGPKAYMWLNNVMRMLPRKEAENHYLFITFGAYRRSDQIKSYAELFNEMKILHDKAQNHL